MNVGLEGIVVSGGSKQYRFDCSLDQIFSVIPIIVPDGQEPDSLVLAGLPFVEGGPPSSMFLVMPV